MARKKPAEWTVRIILHYPEGEGRATAQDWFRARDALWLGELLRYAGHAKKLSESATHEVYELTSPRDTTDTREWADLNARRMMSFGLNAAAAPAWAGESLVLASQPEPPEARALELLSKLVGQRDGAHDLSIVELADVWERARGIVAEAKSR